MHTVASLANCTRTKVHTCVAIFTVYKKKRSVHEGLTLATGKHYKSAEQPKFLVLFVVAGPRADVDRVD